MKKALFILILISISCTNNSNEPIDPTNPPQEVIGLLPIHVKYTNNIDNPSTFYESNIRYDGNKITEIQNIPTNNAPNNNIIYEFSYDGNNIVKIKSNQFDGFSAPQFYYLSYENDRLKRIIKDTSNASDSDSYTDYDITLEWISDSNVRYKVPFHSNVINDYTYYELFFDTNGNLIKSTQDKKITTRYITTNLYEYNSQVNSAFKNVTGFNKLNGIITLFLGLAKHNYSHVFPSEFLFTSNNLTKINTNVKVYSNSGVLQDDYNLQYNYSYEADVNNYTKKFKTNSQPSNTTSIIEYTYNN